MAPMNRHYPPDDDEWKDGEENSQQHVQPTTTPKAHGPLAADSAAGSSESKAPPGGLWPEAYAQQGGWKVPPTAPPATLQQAGVNSGIKDAREYHKKWQDRPYDPNDDPWIEDVEKDNKMNDKPVIQLFGNVVQENADLAVDIARRYCAPDEGNSADSHNSMHRFLYLLQQKPIHLCCLQPQLEVRRDSKSRKAKARNSRKVESLSLQRVAKMRKVAKMTRVARAPGKENSKVNSKGRRKQAPKGPMLPVPKATGHSSKCARISEEPPEVVEANSNKMPDNGAICLRQ